MPTIEEFGQTIKKKYPQYQNINDRELGMKMLEKHPEYSDRVFDTDPESQAGMSGKTEGVFDAVKKGFGNVKDSIVSSGEKVSDILAQPNTSSVSKTAGVFGQMLKPFTSIATEAVATPLRVGGEVAEKVTGVDVNTQVAEKLANAVQAGMDTQVARKIFDAYKDIEKNHPEASNYIGGLLNAADFATLGLGAGTVARQGLNVAEKVGEKTLEAGVKTGKKIAQGAEKTGEYVAGQAYGLKPETVKSIIKNPEVFTEKEMSRIDRDSIFNKVKTNVDKRLSELSETGKGYETIKQSKNIADISEEGITSFLKEKGINIEDGKLKVDLGSDIQLSKADVKGLEEVVGLMKGKANLTAKEVLNLRTRLSNLAGFGDGKTPASKLIAKQLRSKVDEIAKKSIPELSKLDSLYSSEKKLLTKVKSVIFDKDGSIKDNAISKIATLTGKGKEQALARMEKIVPGITEDVNILKAIEDIEYSKGQKVGAYMRTGLGVGTGAVAGGPVGAIIGAIVTSPQVGVSILRAYGKARNISGGMINGMIGKMKSGSKLIGEEKKIMDEAINNASKKATERMKKIRPGLNIEEVPNAINEAISQTEKNMRTLRERGIKETSPQFKKLQSQLDNLRKK